MDYDFDDYPIWILAPKGHVEYAEVGKGHGSVGSLKDSEKKFAPVFSQRVFAERYIQDSGEHNGSVGSIPDAKSFVAFLKNIRKVGATLLLLDHIFAASPYVQFLTFEIGDVLKDIEDEKR